VSLRGSIRDTAGLPDDLAASEGEAERFDPLQDGPDLAYEHLHRYVLAGRVVEGLRVLDLASGTGYGSSILARSARSLVSLDLESAHLGSLAAGVCGDAQLLPFAEGSFDAVVCFEAVEHVRDPEKLVSEARRVLRGPSILMISTPDREIYSGRAKHQNPYHVSEMNRREFQGLLRGHFGHVRILGQGLWAGSWVAGLAPGQAARELGKRSVEALPLPESASGSDSREQSVRWADRGMEELPTPVYLLAACSDSKDGRLLLGRALPRESILHDSGQWLLGQYDRLAKAWGGELASFQAELALAKEGHEDQSAQIEAARASTARLEGQIEEARVTVADLEAQIDAARITIEAMKGELEAARNASSDLEGQVSAMRSETDQQRAELEAARVAADAQATRFGAARDAVERKDRELDAARETIAGKDRELAAAGAAVDGKERELGVARFAVEEKEQEIAGARSTIDAQERELEAARSVVDDKDAELSTAGEYARDAERQIEAAREKIDGQEGMLGRAAELAEDRDREIAALAAAVEVADRRAEGDARRIAEIESDREEERRRRTSLEASQQRFFARLGTGISDWVDRVRGAGQ